MRSALDAVRRPEYTGERRCWPCTLANVAILAVACAVLLVLGAPVAAVALGLVGVVAVVLRGYVVPYTPRFAPRLAARLPGDPFRVGETDHDDPATDDAGSLAPGDETPDTDVVLGALVEAGVVEATPERVSLAGPVLDDWKAEMAELRSLDDDGLAEAVAGCSPAVCVRVIEQGDSTWVVLSDAEHTPASQVWLSPAVAIADAAAVRALDGRIADEATRLAAGTALRGFLEDCPRCEEPLEETTTADCCGGVGPREVPDRVLACPDCDARLYTLPDEE